MKNKSIPQLCLAIMMLLGVAVCAATAQQPSAPAPKPEQTPAKTLPQAPPPPAGAPNAGPASTPAAPGIAPDAVVLKVGDIKITKGQIDSIIGGLDPRSRQSLAMQGRKQLGNQYLELLVLFQQAMNDHLDSLPAVREKIELNRETLLANAEFEKLNQELQVTPDDVAQYFNQHQPDFEKVQMRQFFIRKRPTGATDPKMGFTEEEAKAKAEAIRKAVTEETDLKKVAEQFKDPKAPNLVTIDLDPRPVRRHSLMPALDAAAFSLKDGEVSQPIDVPQGIYLIQVASHVQADQKDVTAEIENILKPEKRRAKLEDLKKQLGVWMDEQYFSGPMPQAAAPPAAPPEAPPKTAAGGVPGGMSAAKPGGVTSTASGGEQLGPGRIRVEGQVEAGKLISSTPDPVYPAEAKQNHIEGVVKLEATLGKDGSVQNLKVISGHPLLAKAALDSVAHWRYKPTLLNGEPVQVVTEVDVNFALTKPSGAEAAQPTASQPPKQ